MTYCKITVKNNRSRNKEQQLVPWLQGNTTETGQDRHTRNMLSVYENKLSISKEIHSVINGWNGLLTDPGPVTSWRPGTFLRRGDGAHHCPTASFIMQCECWMLKLIRLRLLSHPSSFALVWMSMNGTKALKCTKVENAMEIAPCRAHHAHNSVVCTAVLFWFYLKKLPAVICWWYSIVGHEWSNLLIFCGANIEYCCRYLTAHVYHSANLTEIVNTCQDCCSIAQRNFWCFLEFFESQFRWRSLKSRYK